MKAAKSQGGLKGGRFRNQESAYKLWTGTLNHFAKVNDEMENSSCHGKRGIKVIHADLTHSRMKKDHDTLVKAINWFEDNDPFADSRDKDILVSFSTGLISTKHDDINPEMAQHIGRKMQKTLDGKTVADTLQLSLKIKALRNLKIGIVVNEKKLIMDSLKLFSRLIIISERDETTQDNLKLN